MPAPGKGTACPRCGTTMRAMAESGFGQLQIRSRLSPLDQRAFKYEPQLKQHLDSTRHREHFRNNGG
jgi:hypothetical protein